MVRAIQKIDQALKRFYRLENGLPAEAFLVQGSAVGSTAIGNAFGNGALLVLDSPSVGSHRMEERGIEVGIFLSPSIRDTLTSFNKWPRAEWSPAQLQAFAVAAEEVSHFNYLVERAGKDRAVTQFELELQGEVDRFLLAYLAERHQRKTPCFEELFARYFENFRWDAALTKDKKARYEDANRMAKSLLKKLRPAFKDHRRWFELVGELRKFYHASLGDKARLG